MIDAEKAFAVELQQAKRQLADAIYAAFQDYVRTAYAAQDRHGCYLNIQKEKDWIDGTLRSIEGDEQLSVKEYAQKWYLLR